MGSSCSCIKSNEPQTELQVDAVRMKEICKNFCKLAMKIKNTPKLFFTLLKMQARLKGLILRNRIRNVRTSNRINQGKDTSNYTYSASTKIVF